ncbi:MAG: hypothetical protein KBD65_02115 [Candidatus Moranbacteria bacterium]|nr:hypothetical protein [Candidatus Moranbacteria bacterium]
MSKKIWLLVSVGAFIFVVAGVIFWFTKNKPIIQEVQKYGSADSIVSNDLVIDSIYPETFDNNGGKIKATFSYQTLEPFSIDPNLVYFYLIKNDDSVEKVESVLSYTGTEPRQVSYQSSGALETRYFHSFVAETGALSPARYIVRASVDNGRLSKEKEVYIQDRSYIREINISEKNVTFDSSVNLFKSFKAEVFKSEVDEETSFSMNQPGRIKFTFVPKMAPVYPEGWDEVSLTIYPISEVVNWGPDKFSNQFNLPYFVSNVRKVRELTQSGYFSSNIYPVNNFPPVNASPVGTQKITKLNFSNGEGIRFLVSGYHQAVDPAEHPKYIYQGITEDGHYLIVFRYASLFSPKLEKYLKSMTGRWDISNDVQINESFDVLGKETNFSPSLNELDQFVRSIRVRSEWER